MAFFTANTDILGAAIPREQPHAHPAEQPHTHPAELQHTVLRLYDELRSPLLRYAASFGISTHDAEDVLQEVFLALFRHLLLGRPQDNLRGWAFRTTHNLALKRRIALVADRTPIAPGHTELIFDAPDESLTPEENLLLSERQLRLQSVLLALPETDRRCVLLRAEGCRYREIASTLGISLGSVAACLARAFARLERMDAR